MQGIFLLLDLLDLHRWRAEFLGLEPTFTGRKHALVPRSDIDRIIRYPAVEFPGFMAAAELCMQLDQLAPGPYPRFHASSQYFEIFLI